MLRQIQNATAEIYSKSPSVPDHLQDRWRRNEKEDLKTAIDYLYEFKKKIDELHPSCLDIIHKMLQNNPY